MDIPGLIPYTLLVTLAGALVTFRSSDRTSRLVALIASLPALAATTYMFWETGFSGALGSNSYRFGTDWAWIPAIGARLLFGVDGLSA
ncbi:MAG: hypothetical protein LC620_01105, partial [Halobacteriales archaeon]|nr:hypothetical protein [Halobacteriales archaeon]